MRYLIMGNQKKYSIFDIKKLLKNNNIKGRGNHVTIYMLKNLTYTCYIVKLRETRPNCFKFFLHVDYKPL